MAYWPSQCAKNSGPVLQALQQCLRHHGIDLVENSMHCDAAVIWSVLWQGRMQANREVYHTYRSQNRPVICIDVGALRRGVLWKIALNNINATAHYGHTVKLDSDRPRKLGLTLGSKQQGSAVLVALQNNHSLQLETIDQRTWLCDQIAAIRASTDRPIVIRPHPRDRFDATDWPRHAQIQKPRPVPQTYDHYDIDWRYHAVVNCNSGVGIQAALAGCQLITHPTSLAHSVSTEITELDQICHRDRDQWLIEISHTEYTLEEIQQGLWLKRLDLIN